MMTYNVILKFLPDDIIYKGHFPNNPITPGACQIEQIKQECIKILKHNIYFDYIQECKFLNPIIPNYKNSYYCNIDIEETDKNYWSIKATLSSDRNINLKLKATAKLINE